MSYSNHSFIHSFIHSSVHCLPRISISRYILPFRMKLFSQQFFHLHARHSCCFSFPLLQKKFALHAISIAKQNNAMSVYPLFRWVHPSLYEVVSVCPSVRRSVRWSVRPSVRPLVRNLFFQMLEMGNFPNENIGADQL